MAAMVAFVATTRPGTTLELEFGLELLLDGLQRLLPREQTRSSAGKSHLPLHRDPTLRWT